MASAADHFANRETLAGSSFLVTADSTNASAESGEPSHVAGLAPGRSWWWRWTAPASGPMRLETTGSGIDTVLAVYRGSSLASLVRVAGNDDAGLAATSCVTFEAIAGETYQIAVDGFGGAGGPVTLRGLQNTTGAIYAADFSAATTGSGTLVGVQGWQSLYAEGTSGVVIEDARRRAFLSSEVGAGYVAALWLPINYHKAAEGSRPIHISTEWRVQFPAEAAAHTALLLVYGPKGDFLAGLEFDMATRSVLRLDGVSRVPTGVAFVPGQNHRLEVWVDAVNNQWAARIDDATLFNRARFTSSGSTDVSLGSLSAAWTRDSAVASTAAGYFSFADLLVRTELGMPLGGSNPVDIPPPAGSGIVPAPTPVITSPVDGAIVAPGSSLTFGTTLVGDVSRMSRVEFYAGLLKLGEDSVAPYSLIWSNLATGTHALTARAITVDGAVSVSAPVTLKVQGSNPPLASGRRPYLNTRARIPGRVEVERYDEGGAGVAYFDTTPANEGGAFRSDGVDIEQDGAGFTLGWFRAGEWLLYSVEVARTSRYRITIPVASRNPGGRFHLEVDGQVVSGVLEVPDTLAWDRWVNLVFETNLTAGLHDLRLVGLQNSAANGGNVGNLDWIGFVDLNPGAIPAPGGGGSGGGGSDLSGGGARQALANISGRGTVGTSNPMIAGFVLSGDQPRRVLLRAIGPTLGAYGVDGAVQGPVFRLARMGEEIALLEVTRGWEADADPLALRAAMAEVGAFDLEPGSRDAAALVTLPAGVYTVATTDTFNQGGVSLVEVYALDGPAGAAQLVNVSTRGWVGSGVGAFIVGLVVDGDEPKRFLLRGIGPTLSDYGVPDVILDPMIHLFTPGATLAFAENNDWGFDPVAKAAVTAAATSAGAFALSEGSADAALVIDLEPGIYSVAMSAATGETGTGLLEVYEIVTP